MDAAGSDRPGLTPQDRRVLWLMSQGMTYRQLSRHLGIAHQSAKAAGCRAIRRMEAANITQAVSAALLQGLIGRWEDCGTPAAYHRHRRAGQSADPACLIRRAADARRYREKEK